jgi:hypothetical protein
MNDTSFSSDVTQFLPTIPNMPTGVSANNFQVVSVAQTGIVITHTWTTVIRVLVLSSAASLQANARSFAKTQTLATSQAVSAQAIATVVVTYFRNKAAATGSDADIQIGSTQFVTSSDPVMLRCSDGSLMSSCGSTSSSGLSTTGVILVAVLVPIGGFALIFAAAWYYMHRSPVTRADAKPKEIDLSPV